MNFKSEKRAKQSKRARTNQAIREEQQSSYKSKSIKVSPATVNQSKYVQYLRDPDKDIVICTGPAGTGKTMLATQVAVDMLLKELVDQIVIVRPAVGVDGEEHGFLPGGLDEKLDPWIKPVLKVLRKDRLFNEFEIARMREAKVIEVSPIAYMRGETFDNAVIILDEAQNTTPTQFKMVLTRIGRGSKIFVTGDIEQYDSKFLGNSGLLDFLKRFDKVQPERISLVKLGYEDIQRNPVINAVLKVYGEV